MFFRKTVINSILLFFCPGVCLAQINTGFIEHLETNDLQMEHRSYLNSLSQSDSTHYFTARYHLKYFNDSLFLKNYLLSAELCRNDRQLMARAGSRILRFSKKPFADRWFATQSIESPG